MPATSGDAGFHRGDSLGRYLVLEKLGSGGMGVVYAAYDPELDRKIAVKLLRPDASGRHADRGRTRMLREAQALARLSHPNVISVFDVGTLSDQVFVAMEYIDGQTLKDWVAKSTRPRREILNVFIQAGHGLAAAHAAGLVHRDFKPSNVLMGNDGRVRVLDFGLARAPNAEQEPQADPLQQTEMTPRTGALATPLTATGHFLGTPAYMAPEQLMQLPTDQRTDQFSFCAALYEALYGERPFAGDKIETLTVEVTQGRVKEAPKSSGVPLWLRRVLLRGLRPDPKDRYPSIDALLTELGRDPAIGRRRALVVVATAVVLVGMAVGSRFVKHQQSQVCKGAESKLAGVWDGDRKQAISAAFVATGKPYAADSVRAVERALDAYAQAWATMHVDACEATRLRGEQSEELLDLRMECLSQRREELKALTDLFTTADAKVVDKAAQATQALTRISGCANVTALKAPVRLPPDEGTRAKVEQLRKTLASARALSEAGKHAEGLPIATKVVSDAQALRYRPLEAEALYVLGSLKFRNGEFKASDELLNEAAIAAEAGRHDLLFAQAVIALVQSACAQGQYQLSYQRAKYASSAIERLGDNEELRSELLNSVGVALWNEGKYDEALDHHQRALALWERLLGPDHPRIAVAHNNIGITLGRQGKYDEALAHYQRALAIWERTSGPLHPVLSPALNNIGAVFYGKRDYEEANRYFERALSIDIGALGADHPSLAMRLNNLGAVLRQQGKYDKSLAYYERALAINEKALGPEHPDLAYALTGMGRAYVHTNAPQKAIPLLERALSLREPHTRDAGLLAETRFALARALSDAGRDPKRVRVLAQKAREGYAGLGEKGRHDLAAVDEWLAKEVARRRQ